MYENGVIVKIVDIIKGEEQFETLLLIQYVNGNTQWISIYDNEFKKDDILFLTDTDIKKVKKELWSDPIKLGTILALENNEKVTITFNNIIYEILIPDDISANVGSYKSSSIGCFI